MIFFFISKLKLINFLYLFSSSNLFVSILMLINFLYATYFQVITFLLANDAINFL